MKIDLAEQRKTKSESKEANKKVVSLSTEHSKVSEFRDTSYFWRRWCIKKLKHGCWLKVIIKSCENLKSLLDVYHRHSTSQPQRTKWLSIYFLKKLTWRGLTFRPSAGSRQGCGTVLKPKPTQTLFPWLPEHWWPGGD